MLYYQCISCNEEKLRIVTNYFLAAKLTIATVTEYLVKGRNCGGDSCVIDKEKNYI